MGLYRECMLCKAIHRPHIRRAGDCGAAGRDAGPEDRWHAMRTRIRGERIYTSSSCG